MPFEDQDIDSMIAPYRTAAQKLQQPFPMLGGQGGHFALQHPLLAGAINQGLLSAAMTPGPSGPEGVGGGISRALQGVLGANQYQRQQEMMAQMLPYQMMQPRLQAEETLAQIKERGAHTKYMGDMTDIKGQQADINQQKADQAKYGRILNTPEERFAHALHPFKDPQNPTPDELRAVADEYTTLKKQSGHSAQGGYEQQIEDMRLSADPAVKAEGEKRWQDHLNTLNVAAGGQAGARKQADEPFDTTQRVRAEEQRTILDDLPLKKDPKLEALVPIMPNSPVIKQYIKERDARAEERKQRLNDFSNYQRTNAPNYHEYAADRSAYPRKGDSRGMPSGDTRPTTPVDSGSSWKEKP